jgi:hypothetical protein
MRNIKNIKKYTAIILVILTLFTSAGIENAFAYRPSRCVEGDPILNVWFHSSPIDPGQGGYIAMDVGNGDSNLCPDSRFKISINMPNNWRPVIRPAIPVLIPATGNSQALVQAQIDFVVPHRVGQRDYPFVVTVKNKRTQRVTSKNVIIRVGNTPIIENITPGFGPAGTEVTLTGRNFGSTPELLFQNSLYGNYSVFGVPSDGLTYSFVVPEMINLNSCGCLGTATPATYDVLVATGGAYSNKMIFTLTP